MGKQKRLNFCGSGSTLKWNGLGSIFHKSWGRDVEAVKFLWKLKAEAKFFSTAPTSLPVPTLLSSKCILYLIVLFA